MNFNENQRLTDLFLKFTIVNLPIIIYYNNSYNL